MRTQRHPWLMHSSPWFVAVALLCSLATVPCAESVAGEPGEESASPEILPGTTWLPAPQLSSLVEWPAPDEVTERRRALAARLATLERSRDNETIAEHALVLFAHERTEALLARVRASANAPDPDEDSSGTHDGDDATPPDHDKSARLLDRLDAEHLSSLSETLRAEIALAEALALQATAPRTSRREVLSALDEAARAQTVPGLRVVAVLALADAQTAAGEAGAAAATLATVEGTHSPYEALVLYRRAELAVANNARPRAERLYFELVKHLADEDRIHDVPTDLLGDIVLALAEAGARSEQGWVRTEMALRHIPDAVINRIRLPLVDVYRAGGVAMNEARVRLFAAAYTETWDETLDHLELVTQRASEIGGQPGSQLCVEFLDLLDGKTTTPPEPDRIDALVTRCLDLQLEIPRDRDSPQQALDLYDRVHAAHPSQMRTVDRARYGMAMLDAGQLTFAAKQLMSVDLEALDEADRPDFARAAAALRYRLNRDIQLSALSCTLRRPQPFPVEDVRYRQWIASALDADVDADEVYELREMDLAVLLMNGHYDELDGNLEKLLAAHDSTPGAVPQAAVVGDIEDVIDCLDRADQWQELVEITPMLRRRLSTRARKELFESRGRVLTQAHLDLANALDIAGRTEDAVDLLLEHQRTWRHNPRVPELLLTTGALLVAADEIARGVTYYAEVYDSWSDHALADDALFAAAIALRESGDLITARKLLERLASSYTTGEYPQRAAEILDALPNAPDDE